jgi:tetratricopeptide (TPR) repeat protein
MNSVGERLRQARLARGLTQEQLARGLATKGFISQVERDHAKPSLPKLRLLAERLGLPLAQLTGDQSPLELTYLRKSAELAVKAKEAERALSLIAEAEALTTTANERAEVQRIKGTALDELGRLSEALLVHQQAAAMAPPDDPELNAAIYAELATVLNQQERFNHAVEAGLRSLEWLERAKHADPALRARVLTNLGRSYWGIGQLEESHRFHVSALDAATDAESLLRIANAHMSLGVTARATGKLEAAIDHCNRALEILGRLKHERTANRVLNNIGDVYYAMGRKTEARQVQQQCLQRARELKDDFEIGVAGGELARYLVESGDPRLALDLARDSQAASARSGDHLHQAYAAAVEARAAEQLGQRSLADRKFKAALSMLLERNAGAKLAEICAMYAEVLHARGRHDRAFALLRVAAEREYNKLPALIKATR